MSPSHGKKEGTSLGAGLAAGATAGFFELICFHPVDTTAKRLMSYKAKLIDPADWRGSYARVNKVVFRDAADKGIVRKWGSMFPGLGYAAYYKIMQRTYKFGCQPYVYSMVDGIVGPRMQALWGAKNGKILNNALAGSMLGIGEVVLLPFDVLKIKAQTNPETLKGRGIVDLFRNEGFALYRGWNWTVFRNAPGSFSLFGGNAFAYYTLMKLENQKQATVLQHFLASCIGASLSITVASPTDVIKTRIQNQPFDKPERGIKIVADLIKQEGLSAFFKGLTPKLLVVGPKLVFSMTISQWIMGFF